MRVPPLPAAASAAASATDPTPRLASIRPERVGTRPSTAIISAGDSPTGARPNTAAASTIDGYRINSRVLEKWDVNLAASPVEDARVAASTILGKSPTSVSVALEAIRRVTAESTLEDVLNQEYRVGLRFLEGTEIVEGIRAQVIDKDRTPAWSPSSIGDVTRAGIERYFASLHERELGLTAGDRSRV